MLRNANDVYGDSRTETSVRLTSPNQQCFFLLGLLLTTAEPAHPVPMDDRDWEQAVRLLNRVFDAYVEMFFPTPDELPGLSRQRQDSTEVAMPAFLHYFSSGLLASTDQVRNRVRTYLCPFDQEISAFVGIGPTKSLAVADWLRERAQRSVDRAVSLLEKEEGMRRSILDDANRLGWTSEEIAQCQGRARIHPPWPVSSSPTPAV
jgi:hypothetical protein